MIVGIIQARMGSTRLPGKVLMNIGTTTLLELCLTRLQQSRLVDEWIVVTTDNLEDAAIEAICTKRNVRCFRGSEWDVLDRFYQAILTLAKTPSTLVRICCDNPTHHGEVVDFTIREYQRYRLDYFSNGNQGPEYYEDGITSEVFSYASLVEAWKESSFLSEREHVTPYIKKSGKFVCGWRKFSDDFTFKLSVDTPSDFSLNNALFEQLGNDFTITELIAFLQKNPGLLNLNNDSVKGEGYIKSLKEDKKVR